MNKKFVLCISLLLLANIVFPFCTTAKFNNEGGKKTAQASKNKKTDTAGVEPANDNQNPSEILGPSDKNATNETKVLFVNLKSMEGKGIIFGHQQTSYEGQDWTDETGERNDSDVKTAVGDYPGLFGFNLGKDYKLGHGMSKFKNQVINAYTKGALITFHMTMLNPVTLKESDDVSGNPMANILPGGKANANFKLILDDIANLANSLEYEGKKIPVIFRPWHEMSGSWDWWGKKNCSEKEYIAGWRYMVTYLRDTKGVHNLLYAFAPSKVSTSGGYERYPGDDYVDIAGLDRYDTTNDTTNEYSQALLADCRFAVNFAEAHGKVAAITEAGVKGGIQNAKSNDWFNKIFLTPLMADPVARKVVYWMTWTNSSARSYWVPLKGQSNYDSFLKFYNDPYTCFCKDLKDMYK